LILETPSFEVSEVWDKEIDALNRISKAEGEGEVDMDTLAAEIKATVACHSSSKASGSARTERGKKRNREDDKEDQQSVE
jgi:hypothetical protein